MIAVGNDVVDLADPESRIESLHPRWIARVFEPRERTALGRASDEAGRGSSPWSERHRLLWALWAAKESAFKAVERHDRGTVFSPRALVANLPPLPRVDGVARGSIRHGGLDLPVEVRFDGDRVHAVAAIGADASAVLSDVATAPVGSSAAARRLALARLGAALGMDPLCLEVAGRPPVVLHEGRALDACLSLSHHGRFVAFALASARR